MWGQKGQRKHLYKNRKALLIVCLFSKQTVGQNMVMTGKRFERKRLFQEAIINTVALQIKNYTYNYAPQPKKIVSAH